MHDEASARDEGQVVENLSERSVRGELGWGRVGLVGMPSNGNACVQVLTLTANCTIMANYLQLLTTTNLPRTMCYAAHDARWYVVRGA